jgi:peptidoglycan/xylan/chitin deacetylase (PgdA/CDA1 family)
MSITRQKRTKNQHRLQKRPWRASSPALIWDMQRFMRKQTGNSILTRRHFAMGVTTAILPFPAHARTLGTSRVLPLNPQEIPRIGQKDGAPSLPLADGEFVLTFDDGPLPATTIHILDTLRRHQVRAQFFLIGRNATEHPALVQRMLSDGHGLGNHTDRHRWLDKIPHDQALKDIMDGEVAIRKASGGQINPFFRFPGFASTPTLLSDLRTRTVSVWGTDIWASDWAEMTPEAQFSLLFSRMRRSRKGIVLMHDIKAQTARMLPMLLERMAAEGMRIVHVTAANG